MGDAAAAAAVTRTAGARAGRTATRAVGLARKPGREGEMGTDRGGSAKGLAAPRVEERESCVARVASNVARASRVASVASVATEHARTRVRRARKVT